MVRESKIPLPEGCSLKIDMDASDPYGRAVLVARIVSHRGDTLFKLEDKRDGAATRILKRMCREIEVARAGLVKLKGSDRGPQDGDLC